MVRIAVKSVEFAERPHTLRGRPGRPVESAGLVCSPPGQEPHQHHELEEDSREDYLLENGNVSWPALLKFFRIINFHSPSPDRRDFAFLFIDTSLKRCATVFPTEKCPKRDYT